MHTRRLFARLESSHRRVGMHRTAPLGAAVLLLAAVSAPPLAAQDDARQAVHGPASLYLQRGAVRVLGAAGAGTQSLPDLPGASFRTVEALDGGWLVSGAIESAAGRELLLLRRGGGGEIESLPVPPGRAPLRGNAIPLIDGGRLAGLAWLEGERFDRLGVFAAAWDGQGWGEPEAVAAGHEQVALGGAALADGSWLLTWTAVDGEDAETMWSRRQEGRWSAPRRLHEDNRVPDITPVVAATDAGAVVAWSWFDGNDYRMRGARFDGRGWTLSTPFGERGSVEPGFTTWDGMARLLYQTVEPASWAIVEYDRAGFAVRRGEAADSSMARPLLASGTDSADPLLFWPADASAPAREVPLRWEALP